MDSLPDGQGSLLQQLLGWNGTEPQATEMFVQVSGAVFSVGLTVLVVGGAEGLVRDTISWMARRSLSRCSGLLMPISLWISVSDKADMMAPLLTLARHAATYQAGIPNHSWSTERESTVLKTLACFIFNYG